MKSLINLSFLVSMATLFSCAGNDEPERRLVAVNISESIVPTSGVINQEIAIHLKAQAANGCHSNIEMKLIEVDAKTFVCKATAIYKSYGSCPDIIVERDTIIMLTPVDAGTYFIQVNEEPFEISHYQVEVK